MAARTAITIGNFDGAHRGHQALVNAARAAVGAGGRVSVLSFDPHPATILRPETPRPRLSRFPQRVTWLAAAGADEVIPLEPTPALLATEAEAFVASIVERHRPDVIVEGPDFRFGRDRAGSVETLAALGAGGGFEVIVIDPVEAALDDQSIVPVSSSMIRRLVGLGRVGDAAALLGRPHELVCTVVRGDQRGREIGMPTANLAHDDYQLPADGIYAGRAIGPDGAVHTAAISVGTKPTFGVHARTCEAHLVGYDGALDEYGWTITLQFTHWIRDQLAFEGVEPLVAQMGRDVRRVAALVESAPRVAVGAGGLQR